jgi:hypothetical protein
VFHGLLGLLVPAQMIAFAVMRRCRLMRVRGKLVKLSRSYMRIICHILFSPDRMSNVSASRPLCPPN